MIKVCYVLGTMDIGGAEKQLLKLVENIDRKRFIPVLIALRGGAGNRKKITEKYALDIIAEQYRSLYENLASKKGIESE